MKTTIIKVAMAVAIIISVFAIGYGSGKHNIQPEVETVNVSDYDLALAYAQNQYWWSDDYAIAITESNDDKFISYEALDSNGKGVRLCDVDREYAKQYYDSMQSEN